MQQTLSNILIVLKHKKYAGAGLLIAVLYYSLNVLLTYRSNFQEIAHLYDFWWKWWYLFRMVRDYSMTVPGHLFITLMIVSLLFWTLMMLILYKMIEISGAGRTKEWGMLWTITFFLWMLASSCVACGIWVFSFFWLGAAVIHNLPRWGHELWLLTGLILLISVLYFAKNLYMCRR